MPERQAGHSLLEPFRQDPAWQYVRRTAPKISASTRQTLDKIITVVVLLVGLPLLIAAALVVRHRATGPILHTQERIGAGGCVFQMFCFGSPEDDMADGRPPAYRWARTLPQLLNVLRGDMSLVGPPPPRPEEPARALRVRPGVIQLPSGRRRDDPAGTRKSRGMIPRT